MDSRTRKQGFGEERAESRTTSGPGLWTRELENSIASPQGEQYELPLPPAQIVETVVVDAEVVGDFVHHRGDDFVHDVVVGVTDGTDRQSIDEDPIGQLANAITVTFGERDAVVQAQNVGGFAVILDQEDDVVDEGE